MAQAAAYKIWTDGSYRQDNRIIGAGWVIQTEGAEIASEDRRSFPNLKHEFQPHGSDIAEMRAVELALNSIPGGSKVTLHIDCQNVVNWLTAGEITTPSKSLIPPLRGAFSRAMRLMATMDSINIIKITGHDIQHGKAHHQSRMASLPANSTV